MKNAYLLILLCIASYSCKKDNIVPDEVTQFSKEALEASINVYPSDTHSFYENYFNKNLSNILLAKVLVDKNSPFLKSIVINKGTSSGILKGMPVTKNNYLVGRVVETNYLSSRVLLLNIR